MTVRTAGRPSAEIKGPWRRALLRAAAGGLAAAAIWPANRALAQASDGVVKIGVLDDMSGTFADQQGMGDVVSARMAVEAFGGRVLCVTIESVYGDRPSEPDVAMGSARRW